MRATAGRVDERGDDEGGHGGDGADRQVDAAGEHRHRLAAGEDGERDGDLDGVGDPALRDDAGPEDEDEQHEEQEQGQERDERPVAEAAHGRGGDRGRQPVMVRAPQRDEAPNITTTTMMAPSTMMATLGLRRRNVRSVRTSRRMKTATIGPEMPPRPPPRVTPPSTTAATLSRV